MEFIPILKATFAIETLGEAAREADYAIYKFADLVLACRESRRYRKRAILRWLKRQDGEYVVGRN